MAAVTEDTEAIEHALAYAIELYRELTGENSAPSLGTLNQIADFILADPERREAAARSASIVETRKRRRCRRGVCPPMAPTGASVSLRKCEWSSRYSAGQTRTRAIVADFAHR